MARVRNSPGDTENKSVPIFRRPAAFVLLEALQGVVIIDPRELLRDILEQAVKLADASSASLCLIDPEDQALTIEVSVGLDEETCRRCRLPLGAGVTGWVARHGRTLLVPDVRLEPRYVAVREGVRSELAVPLENDGGVLGVINVDSDRVEAFSTATAELLEMLARRCVDAIAYARLYEEVRRKNEQLAALVDIGRELTSMLDLHEVLSAVVGHARRLLGGTRSSLVLERNGRFETVATDDTEAAGAEFEAAEDSSLSEVFRTGLPLVDTAQSSRLLSVPVRTNERVIGVLNVYSAEPRHFRAHETTLLTLLAQQSAVAIENASLFRQVREAGDRLRESEKLAALGRLSAGLAHELRNPLNTLNVLTYAMEDSGRGHAATATDLEVVRAEIRRMDRLLAQFLDFARPRAPRFRREPVEGILEEISLLIAPEAAKRKVELERTVDGATPPVWADRDQLTQLFLNLALNAIQSMTDGGRLRLEARAVAGSVRVDVRDDGPGIPADVRERLFEPFFTTREGGSGLGLPIALRIVEAHSGELRITSADGEGTTATVWLPA